MMLKKGIDIFLIIFLIFTFVGCGDNSSVDSSSENTSQTENTKENSNSQKELEQLENTDIVKTAVVYFSATGNTAEVAKLIAEETKADIIEIVPEVAYTAEDLNYNDENCRANKEMNDDTARPEISTDLSAVSEYDVIYIGYPIWWGTAPRIIQTFLENSDVSQATIYTFCTSGGSGIEQSIEDLQNIYSDITIVSGKRFNKATETDVKEWIDSL